MLRWFLIWMFVVVMGAAAFAQKGKLPPFRMVQENGVVFKAEQPLDMARVFYHFTGASFQEIHW
ncbi:MAG: hypothetical protein E6Q24_19390 [Chitinophagaceae bacterium]|nr:MAG: hypothetical protein E6Q24_19390 [Chitinophagaceae bacterium]